MFYLLNNESTNSYVNKNYRCSVHQRKYSLWEDLSIFTFIYSRKFNLFFYWLSLASTKVSTSRDRSTMLWPVISVWFQFNREVFVIRLKTFPFGIGYIWERLFGQIWSKFSSMTVKFIHSPRLRYKVNLRKFCKWNRIFRSKCLRFDRETLFWLLSYPRNSVDFILTGGGYWLLKTSLAQWNLTGQCWFIILKRNNCGARLKEKWGSANQNLLS